MNYTEIIKAIDEYSAISTEDIQKEMIEILETWKYQGLNVLANAAGISRQTLYQMKKRCATYRPSFELYVRMKAIGKNIYYKGKEKENGN